MIEIKKYRDLVRRYPPRPLHGKADLALAITIVEEMAGFELNEDQSDYVEAISTFIVKYSEKRHPTQEEDVSPLDILKFLMIKHAMKAVDLGNLLGDPSFGADILAGKRELTVADIRLLAQHFAVEPGVFIR